MGKEQLAIGNEQLAMSKQLIIDNCALLILTLVFYWKLALTNLIMAGLDALTYFYPYRAYAAEALRAGRLPLWNPYLFMGVPFLANPQAGVLYPLNWPLIWLSAPKMVAWSVVIHVFGAAVFTYLYARLSLGLGRFGAVVAAIVFAFSGFLGGQAEHVNQLNVSAWLPLLLLLFDLAAGHTARGAGRRRWGYVLLLGVVVALQLTAGHTQAAYICLFGLGLYALFSVLRGPWSVVRASLLTLAAAVALGLALAAAQLLPTAELAALSIRSGGLPYREVVSVSLRPALLPYTLLPTFGEDLSQVFGEGFSEYVGYVGVIALLLAAVAVRSRWWERRTRTLVFLGAAGLFLALGVFNPVYFVLYKLVPGFALFRAPARWMLLYTFAAAALAGLGADHLRASRNTQHAPRNTQHAPRNTYHVSRTAYCVFRVIPTVVALAAFAATLVWLLDFPRWPTLVAWMGLGVIGLALIGLARGRWPAARYGLAVVVVAELWAAAQGLSYNHPTAPEAFSSLRPAPAHLLADGSLYRFVSMSGIVYDPGDLAEIEQMFAGQLPPRAIYDYVVAAKQKEILAPNLPLLFRIPSVDGYDGGVLPLARYVELQRLFLDEDDILPDGRLRQQLKQVPEGRLLSLLNVKYVITDKVYDVWIDGIFYDLQFTAVLGPGGQPDIALAELPDFPATSLGVVSYLSGAAGLADGTPVAEVVVADAGGNRQRHVLRAGVDTAEGRYDTAPSVRHRRARVGHHWRDDPQGNDYVAVLDLGPAARRGAITIRYLAERGQLHLRGLSLIDRRTGTSQSLIASTSGRFRLVHSGDVKIYENRDVLPRAFVVHRARVVGDDAAAVAAMRDAAFRPGEEVLLAEGQPLAAAAGERERVEVVSYQPERVVVAADLAAEGVLVLTDSWYPGWRAVVDGQPVPIHRADVLFRAVRLPAGSHTVEFVYAPASFRIGLAISLAALAGVVIGLASTARGGTANQPLSAGKREGGHSGR